MLELTEEELLIINQNEIVSSNSLIKKEKGFTQLLNTYLKGTFNEEHLEAQNVPGDGSCLYHAILHSFERKYGKKLEIDHKEMRRKVALHMLKFKENITYLNNYSQHENDIINISNSSNNNLLRDRYVKYAEAHMNNTSHWPSELCIHIIAIIYNLEIVVLQEQVLPGIGPLGYIIERLRTTGLENATNATTTATATPATTADVSSFRHMMPSYIFHDNRRNNAPEDQKHIPEFIWEDSSDNESDDKREEMEIFTDSAIPATAAFTTTATAIVTTATTTIASSHCPFIIMIGNRGDQHYYSIVPRPKESTITDPIDNSGGKEKEAKKKKAQKERERQRSANQKEKLRGYEELSNETAVQSIERATVVDLTRGSITIEDVFEGPETDEVIIHKYNIPMTRKDLCKLKVGVWVNDELINFYVGLLRD